MEDLEKNQDPQEDTPILKKKITRSRTQEHIEKSRESLKKAHLARMEQCLPLAEARTELAEAKAAAKKAALDDKINKMKAKKQELLKKVSKEPEQKPESEPKLEEEPISSRTVKKNKVRKVYMEEDSEENDSSSGDEIIYVAPKKKQPTIVKQKASAAPIQPPAVPKAIFKFV
jgi:hypothetical protein